jgi:type II secretory pathway pseudopilin PulG
MIVIAIIGILGTALFPSMTKYIQRSRDVARI